LFALLNFTSCNLIHQKKKVFFLYYTTPLPPATSYTVPPYIPIATKTEKKREFFNFFSSAKKKSDVSIESLGDTAQVAGHENGGNGGGNKGG
jgi:hypothetical protein